MITIESRYSGSTQRVKSQPSYNLVQVNEG